MWIKSAKIMICSLLLGFTASLFALIFKHVTENYEHFLYNRALHAPVLFFILPFIGLTVIYFLRLYVFKNRKNKGISEVLKAVYMKEKLPAFKIPSHFINGFLTVIFGGATGIEVSTVVSTATMGELASTKDTIFRKYKSEFIGGAIAAGVAVLFHSPLGGLFFSLENIVRHKKKTNEFFVIHLASILMSFGILFLFDDKPLFATSITNWNYSALPYLLLLSVAAAVYAVFLTKTVILIKSKWLQSAQPILQVTAGAALLGIVLLFQNGLYGDGYHTIKSFLHMDNSLLLTYSLLSLALLLAIKPIITAVTLSSGGDGGVFAPSIFAGAILGLFIGILTKNYFNPDVYLLNFMIVGVAVTLSATLHAPLTAVFLVCGIFNSYVLLLPLLLFTFISKYISKKVYPYTVYTYSFCLEKTKE